jgi:hypothetical protein
MRGARTQLRSCGIFGKPTVFTRSGGSIPISATPPPLGDSDDPDIRNYFDGIRALAHFFEEYESTSKVLKNLSGRFEKTNPFSQLRTHFWAQSLFNLREEGNSAADGRRQ